MPRPACFATLRSLLSQQFSRRILLELKAYLDAKKAYDSLVINVPDKFANAMEARPGWVPKHLGIADEQFMTSIGIHD